MEGDAVTELVAEHKSGGVGEALLYVLAALIVLFLASQAEFVAP